MSFTRLLHQLSRLRAATGMMTSSRSNATHKPATSTSQSTQTDADVPLNSLPAGNLSISTPEGLNTVPNQPAHDPISDEDGHNADGTDRDSDTYTSDFEILEEC